MAQVEKYGCEKQGKRNGERNDEGSANITEKQKEDDRYQDHSLSEVVQHRVQRKMQQIAAVQHRNDFHTLGQDVVVELLHLCMNPFERRAFFCPLAHQHTALDDVGLIDNDAVRTMIGSGHVSQPNSGAPEFGVEHGNDLHTVGQDVIVEIVHLLVNPVERGAFFGPLAHQHTALDDVGLIDNDADVIQGGVL